MPERELLVDKLANDRIVDSRLVIVHLHSATLMARTSTTKPHWQPSRPGWPDEMTDVADLSFDF